MLEFCASTISVHTTCSYWENFGRHYAKSVLGNRLSQYLINMAVLSSINADEYQ